jgi:hypothetical protein
MCWLPILNRNVLPVQKGDVISRQSCNRRSLSELVNALLKKDIELIEAAE